MNDQGKTMKTFVKILLAGALITGTRLPSQAEEASGHHSLSFNGNVNVWDLSGTATQELGNISLDYSLTTDPAGKLAGEGHFYYSDFDSGDHISGTLSFSGTVRSAGSVVRVNLNIKMHGEGEVQGLQASLSAKVKENMEIDEIDRQLIGSASGKVTVAVAGLGHHSGSMPPMDVVSPLEPDMTGTWDLSLNISTNRTKYSGDAAMVLSNGRSFPLAVKGGYTAKTDLSKLTLKGLELNHAINMSLVTAGTDGQLAVTRLNGKVLGQNLRLPVP